MVIQRPHTDPRAAAARGARTFTRRSVTASGPTYCVGLCSLAGDASFASAAGCVCTLGDGSSAGGGAAAADKSLASSAPRGNAAHGSAERANPPAHRVRAQDHQRARALHTHRGRCANQQGHGAWYGQAAGAAPPQLAAAAPRRAAAARRLEHTRAALSSCAVLALWEGSVRDLGHRRSVGSVVRRSARLTSKPGGGGAAKPNDTRGILLPRALLSLCRTARGFASQRIAPGFGSELLGPQNWRRASSRSRWVSAVTSSAPRCSTRSRRRRGMRATTLALQLGRRVHAPRTCGRHA